MWEFYSLPYYIRYKITGGPCNLINLSDEQLFLIPTGVLCPGNNNISYF